MTFLIIQTKISKFIPCLRLQIKPFLVRDRDKLYLLNLQLRSSMAFEKRPK